MIQAEIPALLRPGANRIVVHGAAFGSGVSVALGNEISASVVTRAVAALVVDVQVAPNATQGTGDVVVINPGTKGLLVGVTAQITPARPFPGRESRRSGRPELRSTLYWGGFQTLTSPRCWAGSSERCTRFRNEGVVPRP